MLASAANMQELPFIGICNRISCGDLYKPSINFVKVSAGLRAAARNAALFAIAGEFFSNFQISISLLHDPKGLDVIGTGEMI